MFRKVLMVLVGILAISIGVSGAAVAGDVLEQVRCMRECVPQCSTPGSKVCEQKCEKQCAVPQGLELRDLRRVLPPLGDLTGVIGENFSVLCGGGVCVCNGATSCDVLIAVCVENDAILSCTGYDEIGRPSSCACINTGG
jgi:hypothetical protein